MARRTLRSTVRGIIRRILQARLCLVLRRKFFARQGSTLERGGFAQRGCRKELLGGSTGFRRIPYEEVYENSPDQERVCCVAAAG